MTATITLSFDDCYLKTIKNVLPLLKEYKFKATFNVPTDYVGGKFEGRRVVDWEKLRKMKEIGMEIAFHSKSHQRLSSNFSGSKRVLRNMSPTRLLRALKVLILRLREERNFDLEEELDPSEMEKRLGYKVVSFVYPGGHYNDRLKKIVGERYESARSTDTGFNKKIDRYALKCMVWTKDTTAEEANDWVKEAIEKDSWLIECFHLVGPENGYKYSTSEEAFQTHLDFVKKNVDSNKTSVKTQREAIKSLI